MMNKLLEYPLDTKLILRKKKSIKRNLLENNNFIIKKIAILGGSTTSEVKNILDIFLLNKNIKAVFYESQYNKYYEDSLFENRELELFHPDIIYIHTSNVNILNYPSFEDNEQEIKILLKNELEKYKSIWHSLSKYECPIIQNNFDLPIDRLLGNLDCYDIHGKTYYINQINNGFAKFAMNNKNIYINDINYLSSYIGLVNWFDRSLWYRAKYAMSMDGIIHLSFSISKIINSIFGQTKKCLVLDLDNTCWGGLIGDDGLSGIKIGADTAIGESFTAFQEYIKDLKKRGIILAVCSKNELKNAKEGLSHPDSKLGFDDFTSFKANWKNKDENIINIAKEINIGTDSLVFMDDNPAERDLVSSQILDISVPDIGNDILNFIDHIDKNGYFEVVSLSIDDIDRNKYYTENKKRKEELATFSSYNDFLISLDMQSEIKPFSNVYLDRITQLINKTNQFNLTTKRYTSNDIDNIASSNTYIKLYGKLSDKYGNNGLISVIIGKIQENQCHIDLWIMSCRVLKRNMELVMLDNLVEQCKKNDVHEIIGYFYKSLKNNMVSNFYKECGFLLKQSNGENTIWKLDISNYKNKNKFIRSM